MGNKKCFCQRQKTVKLSSSRQAGYSMIAANIPHFQAIFQMPMKLDPARPEEGCDIEETLGKHNDKYHQTCCMLYNKTMWAHTNKRTIPDGKNNKMRKTILGVQFEWLLLGKVLPHQSVLRHAMTKQLNSSHLCEWRRVSSEVDVRWCHCTG